MRVMTWSGKKITLLKVVKGEEINIMPHFLKGLAKNRENEEMRKFLKTIKMVVINIILVTELESKPCRVLERTLPKKGPISRQHEV